MKTVIDAVNEFRGELNLPQVSMSIARKGWYINEDGNISHIDRQICTSDEFSDLVYEMSKAEWIKPAIDWGNAPEGATHYDTSPEVYPWIKSDDKQSMYWHFNKWVNYDDESLNSESIIERPKAEAMPVYTQSMADNGELPIAGMECMISDETYSAEYFSGVILFVGISNTVWTHGKVEYSQSSTHLKFKPITPPIDLIDGEAYKFIYNGKFNIGIYDSDDGRFYFPRGYVLSSYPTNIKHLTV